MPSNQGTDDAEANVYVAIMLADDQGGWSDIKVFNTPFAAQRWVEIQLRIPVNWSEPAECMVVEGVEDVEFDYAPARIHKLPISSPIEFAKTWGLEVQ